MADPKRALSDYLEKTWGQLEKNVEDAVQRSVSRVQFPKRDALKEFRDRLDRLDARLSKLEGKS